MAFVLTGRVYTVVVLLQGLSGSLPTELFAIFTAEELETVSGHEQ